MGIVSLSGRKLSSSGSRLLKALKENRGSYTIDRNGGVEVDLNSSVVRKKITDLFSGLENIKSSGGDQSDVSYSAYRGNIWCSPQERCHWRIYITDLDDDPKCHIEAVDMLRSAGEEDIVEILITSPGGYCSIADMYLSAIKDSRAKVITRAIGECCSAAATIFLAGDERVCDDGSYFMFHNVQFGLSGDSANVFAKSKFYERLFKEKAYLPMAEVLSKEELEELFERAGEVYLTAEEMRDRLKQDNSAKIKGVMGGGRKNNGKDPCSNLTLSHDDECVVTLDSGYEKTFILGEMQIKDFDEYSRKEIIEIGDALGVCLLGLTREQAIYTLINEFKGEG